MIQAIIKLEGEDFSRKQMEAVWNLGSSVTSVTILLELGSTMPPVMVVEVRQIDNPMSDEALGALAVQVAGVVNNGRPPRAFRVVDRKHGDSRFSPGLGVTAESY